MSCVARRVIAICVASYEVVITWRGLKAVSFQCFPHHSYADSSDFRLLLARMFGPGIYSSLVSSKADLYSINTKRPMKNRVLIVNQVSLGRTKTMYEADHDMQHAPHLYNSVSWINHATILLAHFFSTKHRLLQLHFRREAKWDIMRLSYIEKTLFVPMP